MKQYLTIITLFITINSAIGQASQTKPVIGKWEIVNDSINPIDLFSSTYFFQFNADNSFNVLKPIEGQRGTRIDESGEYKLINDSIEVKIIQEDGINLLENQSIKFRIIRLSENELILQWPQPVNTNAKQHYPQLKFKKVE